ncbi:MAG: hypothetical protein ACW96S_09315 [Promethearchaeota archaeon]|jgi:hypothetical protein
MDEQEALNIFGKIRARSLFGEDLQPFLEALKYFTNNSEYAEDEIYGWEKIVQVKLDNGEDFYVKTENPLSEHPKFAVLYGNVESPDPPPPPPLDTFTGIMCGRTRLGDTGRLFEVKGDNSQSMIFFTLLMLIGQELWEQEREKK